MLNIGQLNLLVHLKRFAVADKETCLLILDTERTQQKDKLLYPLRPLVKHGYISMRKDNLYGLLNPGRELTEHVKPILTTGGDASNRHRVAQVSHMTALLAWHGIPIVTSIPLGGQNGFIPPQRYGEPYAVASSARRASWGCCSTMTCAWPSIT